MRPRTGTWRPWRSSCRWVRARKRRMMPGRGPGIASTARCGRAPGLSGGKRSCRSRVSVASPAPLEGHAGFGRRGREGAAVAPLFHAGVYGSFWSEESPVSETQRTRPGRSVDASEGPPCWAGVSGIGAPVSPARLGSPPDALASSHGSCVPGALRRPSFDPAAAPRSRNRSRWRCSEW